MHLDNISPSPIKNIRKAFLPYGTKALPFRKKEKFITIIQPEEILNNIDQKQLVIDSLNCCEEFLPDIKNNGDLNVAIGINDQTRPVPNNILIPCVVKYLLNKGFFTDRIKLFIASGTHIPPTLTEISGYLDNEIISSFEIICHNCDTSDLKYLGKTTAGTPVYINRAFIESDIKILIGNIEPHHFMGFSGGVKTASIGLAGKKTITANHSMLSHPNSTMGLFSSNPMRQDVEEIGKMIGIDFVLNVVLDDGKKITKSFWGNPTKVMEEGIDFIRSKMQIQFLSDEHKYDLVIASPGGYPKDINFYQSQKALTHACLFVKQKGVIILVAECKEGLGNDEFKNFIFSKRSFTEIISDFESKPFSIGPHKAYLLAKQAINHKILLVSEIEDALVEKMLLQPAKSLTDAYRIALNYLPEKPKIAILPYATHTMPKIFEK